MALSANKSDVGLCRTSNTLPAHPFPSTRSISKSSITTFLCDFRSSFFFFSLLGSTDLDRFFLLVLPVVDNEESSSVCEEAGSCDREAVEENARESLVMTLSGSADFERWIRLPAGASGATGVAGTSSSTRGVGASLAGDGGMVAASTTVEAPSGAGRPFISGLVDVVAPCGASSTPSEVLISASGDRS